MLERLFTSKVRLSLLTLLLFSPEREFHLRELARLCRTSPTYASKELDNLTKAGLVKKTAMANLSIYCVNEGCAYLSELKQIFVKTDFAGDLIKKAFEGKAKYCFIFGSFAKGNQTGSSDIDLFLVSQMSQDEAIKAVLGVEKTIGREINFVLWDEKTFAKRAKNHHLLKTIKKGRIIMLLGGENEFRKAIK